MGCNHYKHSIILLKFVCVVTWYAV